MYSETKKNIENSAIATSSPTTFVPLIVRLRKMSNGTSGALERRVSIRMKVPIRASATAPRPSVWPDVQPASLASTSV